MLARELFDIRLILRKQGIIFAYSGYVTEAVLSGVGEAIKQKLVIADADTKTLRGVFAVFVEQGEGWVEGRGFFNGSSFGCSKSRANPKGCNCNEQPFYR